MIIFDFQENLENENTIEKDDKDIADINEKSDAISEAKKKLAQVSTLLIFFYSRMISPILSTHSVIMPCTNIFSRGIVFLLKLLSRCFLVILKVFKLLSI